MKGFKLLFVLVNVFVSWQVFAQPDLTIISQSSYTFTEDGTENIISLEFENIGNASATGANVSITRDQFTDPSFTLSSIDSSAFTCSPNTDGFDCSLNFTSFDPGTSATIDLGVTIDSGIFTLSPAIFVNIDDPFGADSNPSNNFLSIDIQYGPISSPDFQVTLLSPSTPIQFPEGSGTQVMQFEVANIGTISEGDQTTVTFDISPDLDPQFSNPASADSADPNWSCVLLSTQIVCEYNAPFDPATSSVINLNIPIPAVAPVPATITNAVGVSMFNVLGDPDPLNNTFQYDIEITAGGAAEIEVTKSIVGGLTEVVLGGDLTYRIEVNNTGAAVATNVDLTDVLPAGVTYQSHTELGSNFICSFAGVTVTCNAPAIPLTGPQDGVLINVIADGPVGAILNTATTTFLDGNPSNNSDTALFDIIQPDADLSLLFTSNDGVYNQGDTIQYEIQVENPVASTSSSNDAVIDINLPAEVVFDSVDLSNAADWDCTHDGAVNGGQIICDRPSVPFAPSTINDISVFVTASAQATGAIATAQISSVADNNNANNTDSQVDQILAPLQTTLAATKTASVGGNNVTIVDYGQNFEYILQVENIGANTAQNVTVTDTLPLGVTLLNVQSIGWTCVNGIDCVLDDPLVAGGTAEIIVEVSATTDLSITTVTNQMQVNGDNTGTEVTADVTVALSDPAATLTLSQTPNPVDPQAQVDFEISIQNVGTTDLTGIDVISQLPTGFTFVSANGTGIACTDNNGTVTCTVSSIVATGAAFDFSLTATAADPQVGQNYDLISTLSANELSADITESLTVAFSTSDFSLQISPLPAEVNQGESFSHLATFVNSGGFDIVNVELFYTSSSSASVTQIVSTEFTCAPFTTLYRCTNNQPIAAGTNAQIEFGLNAGESTGLIGGSVSANADGISKNTSTSTLILSSVTDDLALSVSASTADVDTNEAFAYLVQVNNIGLSEQAGFRVETTLPAGVLYQSAEGGDWSCTQAVVLSCLYSGTLAAGQNTSLTINVIAPESVGVINNSFSLLSQNDENPTNNSSSVSVNVTDGSGGGGNARADLAVSVTTDQAEVINTDLLTWQIEVENLGPDTATGVEISNTLPDGFVVDAVEVSNGASCTVLSGSLQCSIASLELNQSSVIMLKGVFMNDFAGFVVNTVEVQGATIDPNPANNIGNAEVTVTVVENLEADLSLELSTTSQQVQQGELFNLSFSASNLGPDKAVNASITGTLSGLIESIQFLNTSGWACQINGSAFVCQFPGDFLVGSSSVFELNVQTQQVVQTSQPIVFNASIQSDVMDNQPANNMIGFTNEVTRTPTEDEIFSRFENAVGSGASETVIQSIRNVSSYCARSYFMAIEGLCEEFIEDATPENGAAIINAMEELTPNEVAAQSNSAAEIITSQFRNVSSRLAQLRGGGGSGFSISGLNGRYGNESIPLGMLAYLNQSEDEAQAVSNINDFVSPWGFFVNGSISMGERDATGRELGFDFDTFGITAGVDYRLSSDKVVGVALGYANFDSEIEGEAEMQSTGLTLTGYGSFYIKDNFYVDARISAGQPDFEQKRRINFAVDEIVIDRVAQGSTDANQYSVAMSAGYHFNKNSWLFTPNASFRYVRTTIDAFQETGAGGINFAFGEQEVTSMVWSVGASVSKAISLKNGIISPQFDFNLSRETENDGGLLEARFINAPDDEIFWIGTDEPDRTFGDAGIGLVFVGANGKQAYINYRSIFGLDGFSRGTINLGARFEF